MTQRRPPGVRFETWVEKQIREAAERGEFDNLPGSGKPIPGAGAVDDDLWWVKGFLRREGLSTEDLLPTSLRLRKEIERLPVTISRLRSEHEVRTAVEKLNQRIVGWMRTPSEPVVLLAPLDVDDVVRQWRRNHPATTTACASAAAYSRPGGVAVRERMCRCGHARSAHEHYRAGTDCAVCADCSRFRSDRSPVALARRLLGELLRDQRPMR